MRPPESFGLQVTAESITGPEEHSSEATDQGKVIALLTDFGTRDHFVAAVKGTILTINPRARFVDISHEIGPHDIFSAGFLLSACYRDFPKDTVFLCVVDPGVGSARRRLIVQTPSYVFVAPDNGLLSIVLRLEPTYEAFEITDPSFFSGRVSGTFDGRDVFGPVAAHLSNGVAPASIGGPITDPILLVRDQPAPGKDGVIIARVIHIDRFGNLVTDLKPEMLAPGSVLEICGRKISERRKHFEDDGYEELFLIAGSAGYIEIAAARNSACEILGARPGEPIRAMSPDGHFGQ